MGGAGLGAGQEVSFRHLKSRCGSQIGGGYISLGITVQVWTGEGSLESVLTWKSWPPGPQSIAGYLGAGYLGAGYLPPTYKVLP